MTRKLKQDWYILDNASFHKFSNIKTILAEKTCKVLFLPPYSPDLNPIEHYWSPIKNDLKKKIQKVRYMVTNSNHRAQKKK